MDRQTIIRRLAETLTDDELRKIFPGNSPADIRHILLQRPSDTSPQKNMAAMSRERVAPYACSLYTDGASRGNPGPAGAGAVLVDKDGREIAVRFGYLGICTNNIAEYKALILGLQLSLDTDCTTLEIFLDSELVVRQLTGRYKVKNKALKPLFTQAQQLLQKFTSFSIVHIPRAENRRADELANRGIDERTVDD